MRALRRLDEGETRERAGGRRRRRVGRDEVKTVRTPDGRTLAFDVCGDPQGEPVLYQHGVPGSRLRRPLDDSLWERLGVRAITYDRPGYGGSTPNPGRTVADCAKDVATIADALGIERLRVLGISGGGPHAAAVAQLLGDRVSAAALVVPFAPIDEAEAAALMPTNREAHERVRRGGAKALAEQVVALRDQLLADPGAGLRAMQDEPVEAVAGEAIAAAIERSAAAIAEGIRPGPEGWIEDAVALQLAWGFEPAPPDCPIEVWYAQDDVATPATAVARLAGRVGATRVTAWPRSTHLASALYEESVLRSLLGATRRSA